MGNPTLTKLIFYYVQTDRSYRVALLMFFFHYLDVETALGKGTSLK